HRVQLLVEGGQYLVERRAVPLPRSVQPPGDVSGIRHGTPPRCRTHYIHELCAGWRFLLALAAAAPHRRALAHHALAQGGAAALAGLAAAAVGGKLLLEVARRAVRGEEIPQRGAPALDGGPQDLL